jgi:hypothetical protein
MKNYILEATVMRRSRLAVLAIMTLFLFSSCSLGGGRNMIFDNSETKAKERFEQLLELIKDGDNDAIKSSFSKQALSEARAFDDNIERLCAFFQGELVSCIQEACRIGTSNDYGVKSVKYTSWYTVLTDEDEYIFFVVGYSRNDFDPDKEGIYTLRVLKSANKETQFISWVEMTIPGIWVPEEEE